MAFLFVHSFPMFRNPINLCLVLTANLISGQHILFEDGAKVQGLVFKHENGGSGDKYYVETMGSGVCLIDYDNDGDLDIYFAQGAPLPGWKGKKTLTNKLFRNDNGKWVDVTVAARVGDVSYSIGCACGDVDNDGDTDMYVTNYGPDVFYLNNGNGTFSDKTKEVGFDNRDWASSAAFFDADNDGWLDLYVANYVEFSVDKNPWCGEQSSGHRAYCDPDVFMGIPDKFYHNDGQGFFSDWTEKSKIISDKGKGLGVIPGDVDADGDVDIYVANDKVMNLLYINNGIGIFSEEGLFAGVGFNENGRAEAGMGVDFGDVNHDGYLDLFVTNFSGESNTLYINDKTGGFTDKTFRYGLGKPSLDLLGFGTKFIDLDLDGWLDIFVVNGHVIDNISLFNRDYNHAQRKQVFLNKQTRLFNEFKPNKNDALNILGVGRGAAFGDIDNDGDTDVVISNNNGFASLMINQSKPNQNWVSIVVEGVKSNKDGIGARLTVVTENGIQMSYVNPAGSYLSSNDKRVLFGLGKSPSIKKLIIDWPSGTTDTLKQLTINSFYYILEGGELSLVIP